MARLLQPATTAQTTTIANGGLITIDKIARLTVV